MPSPWAELYAATTETEEPALQDLVEEMKSTCAEYESLGLDRRCVWTNQTIRHFLKRVEDHLDNE